MLPPGNAWPGSWTDTADERLRLIGTRRRPTKRGPSRRKPPPKPLTPGVGEKVHVLSVPWEERSLASACGARWHPGTGWVWVGRELPHELSRYAPLPYSWAAYQAGVLLPHTPPTPNLVPDHTTGRYTLRPDQEDDAAALVSAHAKRMPEFLVASKVGTGKTLTVIAAVKRMKNVGRILVICPAVALPTWRSHLEDAGDGGKHWCLINYESAKRLLSEPPSAREAKKVRTKNLHIAQKGKPRTTWDVVITDESHYLGNPASQQSRIVDRIIENPDGEKTAFSVRMSATAGENPAKLSYLHRGLAYRSHEPIQSSVSAEGYVRWCQKRGIAVTQSGFGNALTWDKDARSDLTKMNLLIFRGSPTWAIRRAPDWPEQQRIPVPVELNSEEMSLYQEEWATFQADIKDVDRTLRKEPGGASRSKREATARAKGMAAQVRYQQKAGMLKARHAADFTVEMLAKGVQVAISCQYLVVAHQVHDELVKRGVTDAVMFTGENRDTREDDRIAFQQGKARVFIFTPTESFSVHAGEENSGATTTPRVTLVADPRWSPKKALQVEGRAQRNGQNAPCYYLHARDTVEMRVLDTMIHGMRNMGRINGDDTEPFDAMLASVLHVPRVF